jgi:hypothetical protein
MTATCFLSSRFLESEITSLERGKQKAGQFDYSCFGDVLALEDAVQKAQSEEIRIPFGLGIAGSVAKTKEIINITSAYEVLSNIFLDTIQFFLDIENPGF